MIEKSIVSKNIYVSDEDFDIGKIYKGVKQISDKLGYALIEKEQVNKPGKYGNEIKFSFILDREIDYFVEAVFEINFYFDNINKVKERDHGDCKVIISGKLIYDYKNRWGMRKFDRFLLGLYLKVTEPTLKKTYIIPFMIKDGNTIHDSIKNNFGFYS